MKILDCIYELIIVTVLALPALAVLSKYNWNILEMLNNI